MSDEVTSDQAAAVFRRAAELDQRRLAGDGHGLDLAALEQAGVEAGLSRNAIRQALAEIKAGAVPAEVQRDAVVARTLDMDAGRLEKLVERFMRKQNFRVSRRFDDRTLWVTDRSFNAAIRSVTDFNKRIVLREASQIMTAVVPIPGEPGRSHVRFELGLRRVRYGWYVLPGVAALLGAAGVTVAAVLGTPLEVMAAAPAAAAVTGGAYAGARTGYRGSRNRTVIGIEGFLDELERG